MARRKLPPGIRPRGNGFQAEAYDPQSPSGKWRKSFPTLEEAIAAKEQFERDKHKPRRRRWTVGEFAEEWATSPGYTAGRAESTLRHNKERISTFAQEFAGVPLDEIDRPTARKWAVDNPHRVSAVRAMFGDAMNDGLVESNPFSGLKISKGRGRKDITVLTEQEIGKLVAAAERKLGDYGRQVFGPYLTVAAYSGMRLGELHALCWSDIDWERGRINVEWQYRTKDQQYARPKNGERRTIKMFGQVAEALREIPREGPEAKRGDNGSVQQLVFFTQRLKRMDARMHGYYWDPVRTVFWSMLTPERQEKVPLDFDFHELRHFTGSWLADLGASAQDIALQLGHQDGGRLAQALYIHTYEDNALDRLGRLVATRGLRTGTG